MDKLDQLIKEALSAEEQDILRNTEELGWFALGRNQFRGRLGWVTWVIMIAQSTMFVIGVWCAWHFFVATEVLPAIKWGFSGTVMIQLAALLKFSLMPQIQADRMLRELKRVELLIVSHNR